MKTRVSLRELFWGVSGLVLGILCTVLLVSSVASNLLISERHSPFDAETTMRTIVTNATNHGWKVSRIHNYQEALATPAEPRMRPIRVLELCHPDYDREMLEPGDQRQISTIMPCAIAVYEKADGEVYVAALNAGLMGRLFGGGVKPVMAKVGRDDDEILAFLDSN